MRVILGSPQQAGQVVGQPSVVGYHNPKLKGLIEKYEPHGKQANEGKVKEVKELKGGTKEKKLSEALSSKEVDKLLKELDKQGFSPSWEKVFMAQTITEFDEENNITTLIMAIPFNKNDENAVITYVSNDYDKAAVLTMKKDGILTLNVYDDEKDSMVTVASTATCFACQSVVSIVCDQVSSSGCIWGCLKICGRSANPIVVAACTGICVFICYTVGLNLACALGSSWVCEKVGLCP
ncbi:hypothetical protein G7K71_15185 [Desulfofundulus sp. TPOSR]|uniref:hypothetical protein n=1 Tax=Desulfofundulus sp. TPOSR TaxID=2714340 RepID=UPI00140C70D3|nr:hypothetical protein [Desulfofundulus sp. TPOSR]NHM28293.1 hypothetical protein [Desulfofundulus sp. TPOSR]